ncbi:hypothetical protein [Bacillus sp. FJAT-27251]|uniref:hypothetical protein n=1 Tax=Bacillus sp. FJAT-27251 TaxID=1684142 RepID=UPI0006A76AEA|nr:hypothetical protein [Bacillus sp. FJAT-27251]
MYIGLGIILSIFIFISVIKAVSNRNWTLISSTYGHEEYYKVIGKLKTEGVRFKVDTPHRGYDHRVDRFMDNTQYDIYVKKGHEHLAYKAMQKRS